MPQTPTDDLKSRTYDFMNALASSPVDAIHIDYGDTGVGTHVWAWLHEDSVEPAEEVATEHGFKLLWENATALDEANNPYAVEQGRKRFCFGTKADQ